MDLLTNLLSKDLMDLSPFANDTPAVSASEVRISIAVVLDFATYDRVVIGLHLILLNVS